MNSHPERPFFSICIPCFNHELYIGKTIQSVLEQDFEDFEIIIADNASTDGSREVVRAFDDKRIRLFENRHNIGFAPNLQQVTRYARGKFINLLSSDDLMNPGALREYAVIISEQQEDNQRLVLMSQAWDIDGSGETIGYRTKERDRLHPIRVRVPLEEEIRAQKHHEFYDGFQVFADCMRLLNTPGVFCSTVYSRELWERVEGYNSTQLVNPDKHFIIKVLRHAPLVVFVNRPLYSYRTHQMGQTMQQVREQALKVQIDQYNYLMQYDDGWLKGTGVTRTQQRRVFISRDCLTSALVRLAQGQWTYATRLFAFGWSTYPVTVLREWKAWVLGALLLCGPLGIMLGRLFYSIYKMFADELPSLVDMSEEARGRSAVRISERAFRMPDKSQRRNVDSWKSRQKV